VSLEAPKEAGFFFWNLASVGGIDEILGLAHADRLK
jgi:hypothetical protein